MITIVVLLILAGITISLVFSDNGIIKKAQEAANKTKEAVINEQTQMNEIADYMENMLNEIGGTIPDEPEGPEMPEGWDDTKVDAVESEDNVVVPVPKGYTASEVTGENTVKDGFVIYENTNGEDKYEPVTDESDIETAQTTRNQFVWVPVANPSDMYGTDKDGKKWGKTYYYVDANTIVPFYWKEQNGTMIIEDIEGYREPDVIDEDSSNNVTIIQLETEFNNMIESVEKYGGFYIGRYETGNLSQSEAVVVKNNTDIGDQTWYTMYNKSKGVAANSNVTTTMIWGCQWDAVLRWMYNSGDEEKKTYTYDSTGKGNYYGTNGNEAIPTGSNDAYAVNNIYDMAGNVYENTMEIVGSSNEGGKVARGGNYDGEPISSSVSFYAAFTGLFSNSKIGSRLALYM